MAALVLSVAGAAAGSSLFGAAGAIAGRIVGAVAGSLIDQALFGAKRQIEGPRLGDLDVMSSSEGAPIPRVYGHARIFGQVIWATQLEEVMSTEKQGGKGIGARATTTTYSYFANFAVGLCEGPIGHVGRIWADGKPLDTTGLTIRVYPGSEEQEPDALIVAKQGEAPAYRGLAYVVFERLPLENFGNRIPQLSFEVIRPLGELERMVRAVTLIPGTTEFGYEPATVTRALGPGSSAIENRHLGHAASDVEASLDELQALCPQLERVAIVVAWFGNDLRAAHCTLQPGVELRDKATQPLVWSVAGLDRAGARLVSQVSGRPAFGGTPSDQSVFDLIQDIRNRGLKVTLYPFVMMDVPADNTLPDPHTGESAQPPYPWRGRITCDPAPGQPDTPDGSAEAQTQVKAFFGAASAADFSASGSVVGYDGPDDWGLRRMVLHYAALAAAAGGVDTFVIASELKALTRVRSSSGVYPAVTELIALADDVRAILGTETVLTYGADWTEYGAHVVDDAATEVRFPLDPLWASSSIDVVGVDYYAPLSDWRDGAAHLDRTLADTTYDAAYLAGNLAGGEGYDWFYSDATARRAQTRTPISDGLGKPWVFRTKDFWNWWSQPHYERVDGNELAEPTAWVPQGKPIWLTEIGCPAVDKGANQPSIFPDPKSADGGVPYFSTGRRDDLIQRRYLQAALGAFDPAFGATFASNPVSTVYGGRMVEPSAIHLWTWDARPYPVFPAALDVWSDGANWETGHWLNGRLGTAPLDALVSAILSDSGIEGADTKALGDGPAGYVIDRPMSPRAAIEPLALAYAFDAREDGDVLRFRPRGGLPVAELTEDDFVLPEERPPAQLVRAQETELPREVSIGFTDAGSDYRRAAVTSRRLVGGSARVSHADLAVVTEDAAALRRAEIWLQDLWVARETASFALGMSKLALMTGDVVGATISGRRQLLELREIVDAEGRAVKAQAIDPDVFDVPLATPRRRAPAAPAAVGAVHAVLLELPTLRNEEPSTLMHAAVFASPWPGSVSIWRSSDGGSFERLATAAAPAVIGETLDALPRGPANRWDHANRVRVRLYGGALAAAADMIVLGGGNAAAVRNGDGGWEVLQFAEAELVGERTYELSRLLRGVAGSEWAIADVLPPGAPFVLLDEHLVPLVRGSEPAGRPMHLRIVASGRDHGDPTALALSAAPAGLALKPLAPVHIRGVRGEDGVLLSWRRRARRNAYTGSAAVPLDEPVEAYLVEIMSGEAVVRTIATSSPQALYATASETADFGAPQAALTVRVMQISATVVRGFPAQATINYLA